MFCRNCGNKLKEGDKFCASCGQKVEDEAENSQLVTTKEQAIVDASNNSIKDTEEINKLINYLRNAIILEERKFALEKTINKLKYRIDGYRKKSKKQVMERKEEPKSTMDIIGNALSIILLSPFAMIRYIIPITIVMIIVGVVSVILYSLFTQITTGSVDNSDESVDIVIAVSMIITLGVGLLLMVWGTISSDIDNNKKIIAENKQKEIDFNNFNKEVERYNAEIDRKTEEDNIKLSFVRDKLKETEKILKDLYSLKFIHKKYQNFIAVVTICEYFETGRCSTLEGYIGAYNIFEQESLQKTIISRLDDVLDSLDEIKGNQYAVYCAIQQGNAMSSQLYANMNNISSNLNSGLKSLNESAKYTKENTEIIKYMELLR